MPDLEDSRKKVRHNMKRLVLMMFLALLGIGFTSANTVAYDTNSTLFLCSEAGIGCGTAVITLGNTDTGILRITYVPTGTSVTVDAANPTTNANFGYLQTECTTPSTGCAFQFLPADLLLSVRLNQYLPDTSPTSFAIPAYRFLGGIADSQSGALVQWGPDAFVTYTGPTTLVTYSLANLSLGLTSPASCDGAGNNCGVTTIQGTITDPPITSAVPEPAVSLMLASGLVALGVTRRKRSSK